MTRIILTLFSACLLWSCHLCGPSAAELKNDLGDLHVIDYLNMQLNEAIIQDGFSPPVASRIYAYANLAAYEAYFYNNDQRKGLEKFLNGYDNNFSELSLSNPYPEAAMFVAFTTVAFDLVYRDFVIEEAFQKGEKYYKSILSNAEWQEAKDLGEIIGEAVIAYALKDNYEETRSYPLYSLMNEEGYWEPTPPTYGTAIEPYWGEIRPFILSSIDSIKIDPVPVFDTIPGSEFYELNYEIYEAVNVVTEEQKSIAMHWDGDPMPPYRRLNHVNLIKRQLNPVGHFLAMGKTVSTKLEQSQAEAVENYLRISMASADAMIVGWAMKYEYNLVRPHTYINRYIDELWDPVLVTPLFPEYPSGHSCLAGSSVEVMIALLSDTVSFVDSNVLQFGYGPRTYENLSEAAWECAYSRVYGGIHYMPAVINGIDVGKQVASFHIKQWNMN